MLSNFDWRWCWSSSDCLGATFAPSRHLTLSTPVCVTSSKYVKNQFLSVNEKTSKTRKPENQKTKISKYQNSASWLAMWACEKWPVRGVNPFLRYISFSYCACRIWECILNILSWTVDDSHIGGFCGCGVEWSWSGVGNCGCFPFWLEHVPAEFDQSQGSWFDAVVFGHVVRRACSLFRNIGFFPSLSRTRWFI